MNIAKIQGLAAVMLFFIGLFNIADYFLTMEAIKMGMEEWNPLVLHWIDSSLFLVIKTLVIPVVLLLIWKLRFYFQRRLLLYTGIMFSAYFLLMVYFFVLFRLTS